MGFTLGIVGLPNIGKSTLFNALSAAHAEVSNYPFCTIKPNIAIVEVPDERLKTVQSFMKSPKAIPTTIEFFDIAGLVKNAHQGEGLGNQFLSEIRSVDAIAHVVRCFEDQKVAHVEGSIDPKRDIEIVNLELILSDLVLVEKKLDAARIAVKSGDKKTAKEIEKLEKLRNLLEKGKAAREFEGIGELQIDLLTSKPVLYVANVDESGNRDRVEAIKKMAQSAGAGVVSICAKLETEIKELSKEDAAEYLKESKISELGLPKLIKAGYALLNLVTFFTANEKECRAWTVRSGTKAPAAAGQVHSDFEKGFISVEVIHFEDLKNLGSHAQAREKGLLHVEGKGYVVQDGDLLLFRFNL